MSRTLRPNLPGAAFHITARTHRQEHWFRDGELGGAISQIIREGVTTSDARLMAFTVMSNHFHIVLRQARQPLGWIMQPIMRRVALKVQRRFDFKGHVFEREYFARHCHSSGYLRRAVIYTNINPHRACVCDASGFYPWTTHTRYVMNDDNVTVGGIEIAFTLPLFAEHAGMSVEQMRRAYVEHVAWRLAKDVHDAEGEPFDVPEPTAAYGDIYYVDNFLAAPAEPSLPVCDLRDRAIELLNKIDPTLAVEVIRRSYGPRRITEVRNQVIAGLVQSGHRRKSIANFLRVADATVSTVAMKMRYSAIS